MGLIVIQPVAAHLAQAELPQIVQLLIQHAKAQWVVQVQWEVQAVPEAQALQAQHQPAPIQHQGVTAVAAEVQ
ncbi:MAG: hypothetical protein JWQ06_699 [Mucilaginibacter sp.]|nr:hypothetical protein [Mucilaginibacter sp.]